MAATSEQDEVSLLKQQLEDERRRNAELSSKLEAYEKRELLSKQSSRQDDAKDKADLENALEAEQEYIMHKLHKQLTALQRDKHNLQLEKQQLKTHVKDLGSSVDRLTQEKVDLEKSLEMEEEAFINSLMRQVAGMMQNYHLMEKAMKQHGLKITATARPSSPTIDPSVFLARVSGGSEGHPARRSSSSARQNAMTPGRQDTAGASRAHRESSVGSPGSTLHTTREQLEALHFARRHSANVADVRPTASSRTRVRRDDSISSLSSSMSAMSRDVSVSRESASASGHVYIASVMSAASSDKNAN